MWKTFTIIKTLQRWEVAIQHRELSLVLPRGVGWEGEGSSRGRGYIHIHTYIHLWLICIVWQKPTERCKAIILQLKFFKTLLRKIRDLNKWRKTPCWWIRRLNIITVSFIPKLIYRFNTIPIKITPGKEA